MVFSGIYFPPIQFWSTLSQMPKMKSHSGAKKRIRKTGSGKLVMKRNSRNHLLQQKSKRQKHLSRTLTPSSLKESRNLARLVPYA
jgi:large subunit ribosomal protein L35